MLVDPIRASLFGNNYLAQFFFIIEIMYICLNNNISEIVRLFNPKKTGRGEAVSKIFSNLQILQDEEGGRWACTKMFKPSIQLKD
jgi:hypothetical protein